MSNIYNKTIYCLEQCASAAFWRNSDFYALGFRDTKAGLTNKSF